MQPADTCLYRIDNPTYASPLRRAEDCSGANPRVIQHFFVDPPECQCQACPSGWTSSGGAPKVAFCYPTVLPRYFKMDIEITTPNNYSQYDFTDLTTAEGVLDAFAQAMVAADVRRYGALALLPPTTVSLPPQDLYFGVQPRLTSIFATMYTFNGTEADLAALISASESCRALGTPSGCASCRWDLCGIFSSTAPSSVLYRIAVSSIPFSMFNIRPSLVRDFCQPVNRLGACLCGGCGLVPRCTHSARFHPPRKDPLEYPSALMIPRRRRLVDTKSWLGFASTVFGNGGKLGQLFKEGKLRELKGLAFSSAFVVAGFLLSFFSSSGPDPNTELLKSINQTVTATYEVVLQIQDELQVISNQLASLQNQITAIFNALNTALLTTQCITSFGTLHDSSVGIPRKKNLRVKYFLYHNNGHDSGLCLPK